MLRAWKWLLLAHLSALASSCAHGLKEPYSLSKSEYVLVTRFGEDAPSKYWAGDHTLVLYQKDNKSILSVIHHHGDMGPSALVRMKGGRFSAHFDPHDGQRSEACDLNGQLTPNDQVEGSIIYRVVNGKDRKGTFLIQDLSVYIKAKTEQHLKGIPSPIVRKLFLLKKNGPRSVEAREILATFTDEDIPALIQELRSSDEGYRSEMASFVLANIKAKAVPLLVKALKAKDKYIRANSAYVLERIGPVSREVIDQSLPALIEALKEHTKSRSDWYVNTFVTLALERMGPVAAPAEPALTTYLQEAQGTIRGNIASALGAIGSEARNGIPTLMEVFRDVHTSGKTGDDFVRDSVARAIATIGVTDNEAVPMLRAALMTWHGDGNDALVHRNALDCLEKIATREAVAVIEEYKKSAAYKLLLMSEKKGR